MRRTDLLIVTFLLSACIGMHALFLLQPRFMDERATFINAISFFDTASALPAHTQYPTLYSYLAFPFVMLQAILEASGSEDNTTRSALTKMLGAGSPIDYALPRMLSLGLLLGSGFVFFRAARLSIGHRGAAAGMLMMLASPALLAYGSYALPETTTLFLSTLSLFAAMRSTSANGTDEFKQKTTVSAAFAGMAISAKYSALSAAIPVAVAIIIGGLRRKWSPTKVVANLIIAASTSIIAFVFCSPGWILDPGRFVSGLTFEIHHARDGHLGASGVPVLGHIELLATSAPALSILALAGVFLRSRTPSPESAIAFSSIIGSILLASTSTKQSPQYMITSLPALAWLAAETFTWAAKHGPSTFRFALSLVVGALVILGTMKGIKFATSPNTLTIAGDWLRANVEPNSKVVFDWAYVPDIRSSISTDSDFTIARKRFGEPWPIDANTDYVVTSSQAFSRYFCHGLFTAIPPNEASSIGKQFRARRREYEQLFHGGFWHVALHVQGGNGPDVYVLKAGAGKERQNSIALAATRCR